MNIAIFGSCVSRDTCEFMPGAQVLTYVARQSVTSLISPHGRTGIDLSGLESAFQRRMVQSDLDGTGFHRIANNDRPLDLVIIDLVDERRGYWEYPDGTTITNSVEIESSGVAARASEHGAKLVEFGTDQHFEAWKKGFSLLIDQLHYTNLLGRTVLLDIEWARAIDEAPHPKGGIVNRLGRRWRQMQRGIRDASRQLSSGYGIKKAWDRFSNIKPTLAEEFSERAMEANYLYRRYRKYACSRVEKTITRSSQEVRINSRHKWGPQPFHYRDADYRSIVTSILADLSTAQ
ncbi:DUF6270 domain-containing protein [Brevibacterium renqingii]|uniref:DUF6270 domain-containing protein n=1 Tax=Brevibacterium renqingii TaxID=2776916 RepID=UPI001AE0079D|nr:DUF6270 domain-containing protein [Brevibacterium renqingii]